MKMLILFTCLITNVCNVSAQVAINRSGTPVLDTSAMLEVQKAVKSKVRIASANYTDTSLLELSNRTIAGAGTDFLITAKREVGLFFSTTSDLPANTNDSLFVIRTSGKIGIGKNSPTSKLDVNGDINLTSYLRLNGNAGANGQVLTATGTGAPQWKATSFANTTRFYVKGATTVTDGTDFAFNSTVYNLNTADVSIGTKTITINKAGLYHFDGTISGSTEYFPNASFQSSVRFILGTGPSYQIPVVEDLLTARYYPDGAVYQWWGRILPFSFDVYLNAGTVLTPGISITPRLPVSGGSVIVSNLLDFKGYLLSE